MIGLAGTRCVLSHPPLAQYLLHHAQEELGHDQWALQDLAALGVSEAKARKSRPVPACAAMVGFEYYIAGYGNPVALFGWLYVLEAMANGVPVVQPSHGAFPELIAGTGGGALVEAGSVEALADGIFDLWQDPERRQRLGRAGQQAVHERYNADVMAAETLAIYERVVSG